MERNQILLFAHSGSGNHGCEAIVRSTICILQNKRFLLFSHQPIEENKYGIDQHCMVIGKEQTHIKKFDIAFLKAYYELKVKKNYVPLNELPDLVTLRVAKKGNIAFSIGGDNYCYNDRDRYMRYHTLLNKRGVKTVLWGCSVEPSLIDDKMRKDLSRYNLITARESITYEALRKINSNVVLAPDPAFTLQKAPGNFPEGLGRKPYIGINVSPLIQGLEQGRNITMENYRVLVAYILQNTDRDIALIPHVVWNHNDDRVPLGQLYEEFRHTGRVFMVEDQNCMQLKDIISGCEFFVGARTHATIAAYSTGVPTLVVGYSVKSRGIARNLFGSEESYVLPVQELRDSEDLAETFSVLYARKDEIHAHLSKMMPGYIAGIEAAKEAVERL